MMDVPAGVGLRFFHFTRDYDFQVFLRAMTFSSIKILLIQRLLPAHSLVLLLELQCSGKNLLGV